MVFKYDYCSEVSAGSKMGEVFCLFICLEVSATPKLAISMYVLFRNWAFYSAEYSLTQLN